MSHCAVVAPPETGMNSLSNVIIRGLCDGLSRKAIRFWSVYLPIRHHLGVFLKRVWL